MVSEYVISLEFEGGVDRPTADVVVFDSEGRVVDEQSVQNQFTLTIPATLVIRPSNPGYWGMVHHASSDHSKILIPKITSPGNLGWWHTLHGISNLGNGGAGIRIGIIDEALAKQGEASCIRHVHNLGGAAWSNPQAARAFRPTVLHSLAVCSLIASRPLDDLSVSGIAPQAETFFAAAGDDHSEYLNPTRLANSIDLLVDDFGCHLIVVSAGDSKEPTEEIRGAVQRARKRGCLCLFAAGNEGGSPMFPARYSECLAVGACGKLSISPKGSVIDYVERTATIFGDDELYLWTHSATGPEVDLLAAGVGTLWSLNGRIAFSACGTSYAAPVAAGVLANLLAEEASFLDLVPGLLRSQRALQLLTQNCYRMGFGADITALGVPIAQETNA